MINLIIIHGEKPTRAGSMHRAFKERLDGAVTINRKEKINLIVITGGKTRKNTMTEAEMGFEYLKDKLVAPIILENRARTTSENIRYSKDLVKDKEIGKIFAITSKKRIFRARYLYKRLWPEMYPKINLVPARDYYLLPFYLIEFIYLIFSVVDPWEKTLAHLPKKIFRNT